MPKTAKPVVYLIRRETPGANLSAIMHSINGSYTTYFNKKRKRSGHLFQQQQKHVKDLKISWYKDKLPNEKLDRVERDISNVKS